MREALEGQHYCKKHQGNHSHYAEENCALCKAKAQADALAEALRELAELAERCDGWESFPSHGLELAQAALAAYKEVMK